MSCNKFFRYSNFIVNYKSIFRSNPMLFVNTDKASLNGLSLHSNKCFYSSLSCVQRPFHKKNKWTFTSTLIPVSFASTNDVGESYRVIVTEPGQPTTTTEVISDVSKLGDPASVISSSESINLVDNASLLSTTADAASSFSNELQTATQLVEPTLASLGLCNWTPVGLVQMVFEYVHVTFNMPWWSAIVAGTFLVRIIMFPLTLKTQRSAINSANYMPQLQYLQAKFGEARRTGNAVEASRYASEIMMFMKEHDIKPLKSALLPMLQAPVFISFFMALRSMANTPVESMMYGGIGWVTDLTIPDPYYILPVIASATLYAVLKVGAESGVKLENLKLAKYFLQALPLIAFPFMINFPAAILYYWVTTNFCTLIVVTILKVKPVRQYFNLPTQKPVDPMYVLPKKGFIDGVKEAYSDQKILAAVEDRRRIDSIRFQKAGTGPIPRTYSYDPTKPRPSNAAAAASRTKSISSKD